MNFVTPIDIPTIEEKLKNLREVIEKLEQCKKVSEKDFVSDFRTSDATMYNLVLGIEIVADIGNHFLAQGFQIKVDSYTDIIEKLGKAGIVPQKFAQENVNMTKFRNLVIHQYGEIDLGQVYKNLQKAPDIFRKFVEYYVAFLEKVK